MTENDTIRIWTSTATDSTKAALPRLGGGALGTEVVEAGVDKLTENLTKFLEKIRPLLDTPREAIANYYVDEIELNLAINASGGIELVGKLEAGAQAGLKLKLKRKTSTE